MKTELKKLSLLRSVWAALPAMCCVLSVLLVCLVLAGSAYSPETPNPSDDAELSNQFYAAISEALYEAESAVLAASKAFWVEEDALVAPVPDPEKFGSSDDPSSLQWLLEDAARLLDGQDTLFSTDIELLPNSTVTYYLDNSILAITWKQAIAGSAYTISEIKIRHPSQFRRYVAEGDFNSKKLYTPSTMSQMVNAVVGSSADHYRGRRRGVIVYDGEVMRVDTPHNIDTCYIDDAGNLIFSYQGELTGTEDAQAFVDEHNIRFSLAFGPILIDNGIRCEPENYTLGEVNDNYARAALCQLDKLHYLIVVANSESGAWHSPTIHEFAEVIDTFGCQKAYALDGGNTGSVVMNGKLINRTPFGYQRPQGDIIYFCTSIPTNLE